MNEKTRIFFVTNARLPTEKAHGIAIMKTCEALARAGVEVELIAPRRRNSIKGDPFSYYGIERLFSLRLLFTLDIIFLGRTGFLIQEISFAIAAAFYLRGKSGAIYSRDDVVLWVLSLLGAKRFIWESHTGGWNIAARSVARQAKCLSVISQGLKDFYAENGIPPEKISVIPSAIDLAQFSDPETKEVARRRLGLPSGEKIALYIGRLDGWKGSRTILEASEDLAEEVRVAVIGGSKEETETFSKEFPRVIFLGYRPYSELSDNQSAADVLVVPNTGKDPISARFTSPLKLIAHMASGRPVVASDLPSIREIAGDNAAMLVAPDDPKALAAGIRRVLEEQNLAEALSREAQKIVKRYTWNARAQKIIELCRGL